ncbi:hypothetical protein Purlil1_2412 [Purpureocillium lilacinum]|uniref:Uncharacterized protein n=1 Tax=Purpureocillium lilacinum TaxID=33203 RepID=A0ABR0CAK1_PURLI|nr:hypothetical protein Purlil1_2412 [Purpureocillium lilacinum]
MTKAGGLVLLLPSRGPPPQITCDSTRSPCSTGESPPPASVCGHVTGTSTACKVAADVGSCGVAVIGASTPPPPCHPVLAAAPHLNDQPPQCRQQQQQPRRFPRLASPRTARTETARSRICVLHASSAPASRLAFPFLHFPALASPSAVVLHRVCGLVQLPRLWPLCSSSPPSHQPQLRIPRRQPATSRRSTDDTPQSVAGSAIHPGHPSIHPSLSASPELHTPDRSLTAALSCLVLSSG